MNLKERHPYLIVELANSHGGKKEIVEELILEFGRLDYARKGIKFQVFSPEKVALPDFDWFSVYEELFFEKNIWDSLISNAVKYGDVWIDIFDAYGVEILGANLDNVYGVKIQASVLENYEVRDALGKLNLIDKQIIINISGIDLAKSQDVFTEFKKICPNIIIQVGYQSYPTRIEDTGLNKILVLKSAFPGTPICMADHADAESIFALNVPSYAALLGCEFIEKHFCLNRKKAIYDGYSALEFSQLTEVAKSLNQVFWACQGDFISKAEAMYLEKSIQVPVVKNPMLIGELVASSDIIYRRTSQTGISARELVEIRKQGKVLSKIKPSNSTLQSDDFRKSRVAVIVAGRMKSTRLTKKAILPIAGMPSVERCLSQCRGVKGADMVVLATSTLEEDSVLEKYTLGGSISFWQGHPDDVISRYLGACDYYGIDVVVRITADCPLILPEIIDYLLEKHFEFGADYTAAEECAVGTSGEIINVSAMRKVASYFGSAKYSEYMTWYFRNNPEHFKLNIVKLPNEWIRDYRMTLDYPEDLEMFEKLYSRLDDSAGIYSLVDVFGILDSSPDINSINKHLTLKYKTDHDLIKLLNNKTKME